MRVIALRNRNKGRCRIVKGSKINKKQRNKAHKAKETKNFWKRMAVMSLVTVQFATLLTPFVAYAEEAEGKKEDTESELSQSVRQGNAYAEENALISGAFEGTSVYDPYVHYVTTYNTLMSRVNEGAKSSPYAKVYKGEHGKAVSGTGAEMKHEKKSTDAKEVIEGADDKSDSTGDEKAGDATQESPTKDMTESEAQAEIKRLSKIIATKITDNMMGAMSKNLAINVGKGDVKYHDREDHGYNTGKDWYDEISDRDAQGSGFIKMSAIEKSIGSGGSGGTAYTIYKEKLYKIVYDEVSNGRLGLDKVTGSFSTSSGVGSAIKKAEKAYEAEYDAKGVDTGGTGLYLDPGTSKVSIGNNWKGYGKLKSWDALDKDKNVQYLIRVKKAKDTASGRKVTESHGVEFIKNRYMWTFENLPVNGDDKVGKALTTAYNNAIGADSKTLSTIIRNSSVEVPESVRTVAWTPVYPEIVAEDKIYDELKEGMERADKKASVKGDTFTYVDAVRPLQTMDLFINTEKQKHSPVLIGAENSTGLGQISMLRLGGMESKVTSKDKATNQYVWYIPSATANPKEQKESSYAHMDKGNYLLGLYTSKVDDYSGTFLSGTVAQDATIGADNYGNIINGETGDVLVPYWHNHMFNGVKLNNTFFPYSPVIATYGDLFEEVNTEMLATSGIATNAEIETFIGKKGSLYENAVTVKDMLKGGQSIENSQKVLEKGLGSMSHEDTMRAMAVVISASTEEAVKQWNTSMLADAKKGGEMYISFEPLLIDKDYEEAMDKERWTASSLIQKMGWIMDYGFADVIQLTIVSNLTRTYNTTIGEAGLEYIFYTDNVTNSDGWGSLTVLISTVIGAVMMGYLLYIGFQAYRGDVTWTKVLMKTVVLAGVLFYPMFVYGNLVEYTINKPTTAIMGNQMRLSVVLDTYFAEEETSRNVNEFYENMFGKYADSDSMQMGSYNITFYTTTDKNGFDINTTNPEDSSLSMIEKNRLVRYQEGRIEYPKENLISVRVPLTDLYKWVWDVRYKGEGLESETSGRDSRMPTYEEVVEAGTVEPLFQWLAKGGSSYFGVEGYDEELASYEEYKMLPEEVKPGENTNNEDIKALSTYGAGVKEYIRRTGARANAEFRVSSQDVESNLDLEVVSASELFYEIVYNSSRSTVDNNLGALEKISDLATTPTTPDAKYYQPTDDDIRALIRDLSTTAEGRSYWYGQLDGWSNFTRSVLTGSQGTGGTFVGIDGVERKLGDNPNLNPPAEDFLGLTGVVKKYLPNRGEVNPYKRETLEEDVSQINSDLLNNYISTYSITKKSLGADNGRNQSALDHAEKMVMSTEAFFQFNDAVGWEHFPQTYSVDSIKFDKYMALVFIPFKDYGKETMTFYDDSAVIPMTTAEYVGMNDSIWEYFAFIVAVLALVIFGLFYLAILYFGLLVFSMFNFVKYYVLKSDYQNKSALGSVVIILTLSASKLSLMLVIYLTSWIMNKSVAVSSMNLPAYPTTLVHSLAIVGSVIAIFMVVIRPVWKGVINDRENMGGQFFADKAQDFGKKITSGSFLPGRGKGVNGGSQASKFNKENRRTGKGMRNNAGRLGNMDERGLSKARKQAGAIGAGAFGIGGGNSVGANARRSVDKVKDALGRTKDKVKGIDRTGRKTIDTTKVKASNLVERAQITDLGRKMNGVVQTASGLGLQAVKGAMVGQELSNFQTGMITTMALGSAGAATVVAKNLLDKGIKARTDGNKVLFNSSGYDLSDTAVRSELFNNSVAELQDQNIVKHANIDKGKVDGSTAINYDYSKGDSRIGLALDSKTGVHPETFNQLANTQEFKELFIKPRAEELTYDRKGNVIGLPEGGLRLVNPQMSASQVQQHMNKIYNADNTLRQENKLDARQSKDMNAMKIDGMEENYYNQHIAPIIKDQKGMYTQGSRIVYNSTNPLHQTALRNINQHVKAYNKDIEQNYGNESNNLMRYVMKEGDNQGIVTETVNGDDNKVLATMVYGNTDYKQNVSKFKVDETEIGSIGDNVQAVNKLRNLSVKNSGLSSTVNEFTQAKKDLRNILNSEVRDMSSENRTVFSQEMMDYLDTTQVSNTPEFKSVKSNLHDIENRYKQQEISADQYHDLVRRENDNLMTIMDSSGKLDGFILNRYDTTNPYVKKYEEKAMAKASKGKDGKVGKTNHKTLKDRYNQSVDKLDKEVGRKNLMEMPLGVVESTVSKHGEEYQLDGKGVLVQRKDARRKRNSLEGKDKDAVMSYLMKRPLDIKDVRSRKLGSQ